MKRFNKFFSEEGEQGIPDYTQYNKAHPSHGNDGGGRPDNRNDRHQQFNDRGGGSQRPRRDYDRERQQREYEIKKNAETRAELKALKEAMKSNEDPYKDAMRREDYYRARRKRDLTKLMWLALAGTAGYQIGHHFGGQDKERDMRKEAAEKEKKGSGLRVFADPRSAELVTRYFNAPGMYGQTPQYTPPGAASYPQQVQSAQQPLQSASIGAQPQAQAQTQGQRQVQGQAKAQGGMSSSDAAKIQKLDTEINSLRQDNMAKQQQLQQLSQQNFGGALRNIQSDYQARDNMKSAMNAMGNVVRGVGSGMVNAAGDALGAAWNGAKTLFASDTVSEMERYFAEQEQNAAAVIKEKTETLDKLKKQNKELTEAVDEKENSLGTMFYQLSAASPMAAGQVLGAAGNLANNAVIGGINLANQAYGNLTGGKQLVNTKLITTNDGGDLETQLKQEKQKDASGGTTA